MRISLTYSLQQCTTLILPGFYIHSYSSPLIRPLDLYATCGKSIHRQLGFDGFVTSAPAQRLIGSSFEFRAAGLNDVASVVSVFSEVLFPGDVESPGQLVNGSTVGEARFLRRAKIQLGVGVFFFH